MPEISIRNILDLIMEAAVIVLYKPEYELLEKNINSIITQVDYLILVDNDFCYSNLTKFVYQDKVHYISCNGNKGIAYALNRAVEFCHSNKISWLLTLDQDSVVPANIINVYSQLISSKTGLICCAVNYNGLETNKSDKTIETVATAITSASYVNVDICYMLGGFDESMFIDRVDFEYCYRLTDYGLQILKTNQIILDHTLGNLCLHKVFWKTVHVCNHSAIRKYYIARNLVYCHRKHRKYESFFFCFYKELTLILKTIVFEDNKIKKIVRILSGIINGKLMKISKINYLK